MTNADPDPYEGLPGHWSESAKATFIAIEAEHDGRLSAAQEAALYECVAMLAEADALDAIVREDGYMIDGYRGKRQINPAVAEARAQRRTALEHLKAFGLRGASSSGPTASSAGSALAAKRWGQR